MNELNRQAAEEALLTFESYALKPTSLISYQSNGRVIVLGDEQALNHCKNFSEPLKTSLILMQGYPTELAKNLNTTGLIVLNGRKLEISGHLGQFNIHLIDELGHSEIIETDIVLDLNAAPLVTHEILPEGYLHEVISVDNSQEIETRLIELTGEFEKPKFFNYNESICAHGVNGKTVCTKCIDACPTGAISSLIEKIEVDSHLCQGGGSCASVCPSGAIQYAYPRLDDNGNRIRVMLKTFHDKGGSGPVLVFHSTELKIDLNIGQTAFLPVKVEEIASVGMDLCLSALVYGASQVVLLTHKHDPSGSLKQLSQQLDWLQSLLSGLGLNPLLVTFEQDINEIKPVQNSLKLEPALYSMPANKRDAIFQAIDHLYQQLEKTRELVTLSEGAPFGTASIDENRCTLCMACVGACPGKALQDGSNRELPEVFFIESNCIQCGTCTQTCPEQAIFISPRMIFNREKRNKSRVLNQDTPFACISCGKAFAPTSVIQKMNFKLQGHYMFKTSRALDRLKMCTDCRVADIVQDPEALNGNFDPLNSISNKELS